MNGNRVLESLELIPQTTNADRHIYISIYRRFLLCAADVA
jgi:hypothetical protein